jgi:hypothetical protein
MHPWLGLGIFLLGAGVGALLTHISMVGKWVRYHSGNKR